MIEPGKPIELRIGDEWTDISPFVDNVVMSLDGDEDKQAWGDYLKGLEPASVSLTLDNSAGAFTPFGPAFFPAMPPKIRVTYDVPDGRWQGFKQTAKMRFPRLLRWLKVRYRSHSFDAVLETWSDTDGEFGVSGKAEGPITMSIEEKS